MIAERIGEIRASISEAEKEAGRPSGSVKLIAVTKYVDIDRIGEAIDAGVTSVGENRVQEYMDKLPFFDSHGAETHIIGQLQTNKVKYIVGKVSLIQSVDREKLAVEINRVAAAVGVIQDILIEVNIGGEEQKGGVSVSELDGLLTMISGLSSVSVKGLMCIPPAVGDREAREYFSRMRKLFDLYVAQNSGNIQINQLSMGMSGDYIAAIKEGATMVRIGTGIFGPRNLRVG